MRSALRNGVSSYEEGLIIKAPGGYSYKCWLFVPHRIGIALVCITIFSSSVIFLLVDACVGLNWLLVSFLSHVNKNIIHSFI